MAQRVTDEGEGEDERIFRQYRRGLGGPDLAKKIGRSRQSHAGFAKVPLDWAARAAKVTKTPRAMVWIWLLYMAWERGSRSVRLANVTLRGWGVSRRTKWRVLQDLEKAGLILIERRPRKSPRITVL